MNAPCVSMRSTLGTGDGYEAGSARNAIASDWSAEDSGRLLPVYVDERSMRRTKAIPRLIRLDPDQYHKALASLIALTWINSFSGCARYLVIYSILSWLTGHM